jgi:hypothetical protein
MNNTSIFDVLVVYSDKLATSASSKNSSSKRPFSKKSGRTNYNDAYAYFLKMCSENYLNAAFTTSSDIIGPGKCSSYWLFNKDKWQKVDKKCYSPLIFDKFSPRSDLQKNRRKTLFSNSLVKPFNTKPLFYLFFDKQKTYEYLQEFSIPTVEVLNTKIADIKFAIETLSVLTSNHPNKDDFSRNLILKDRFGAGGNDIYYIDSKNSVRKIAEILKKNKEKYFIIQPFVKYDKGHEHQNYLGFIDIRTVFVGNKLIQTYIRIAKDKEFRCNEHKGATLLYISKSQIPTKVLNVANKITSSIGKGGMLFALDFIISNSGNVYLVEGNCGPGIDWNLSLKENEIMAKKLIRKIVTGLSQKVAFNDATRLV